MCPSGKTIETKAAHKIIVYCLFALIIRNVSRQLLLIIPEIKDYSLSLSKSDAIEENKIVGYEYGKIEKRREKGKNIYKD